jgi:hypothetical protein
VAIGPALAAAQASATETARPAERLLGAWVGASVGTSNQWGRITDRRFFIAALRAQYLLETFGGLALANTIDVVPLAILTNTPEYRPASFRQPDGTIINLHVETGRSPVFGAGIVPAGLQLYTLSHRPARFFLGASAGTIWFTRNTPVPDARRMNIALDLAAGAELLARDGRVIVLGYKFQHLSNGGTAPLNPGVDSHMLYVGLMRRRIGKGNGQGEPVAAK